MRKPLVDVTPTRLEALLELSLRTSAAATDPFKDNLRWEEKCCVCVCVCICVCVCVYVCGWLISEVV